MRRDVAAQRLGATHIVDSLLFLGFELLRCESRRSSRPAGTEPAELRRRGSTPTPDSLRCASCSSLSELRRRGAWDGPAELLWRRDCGEVGESDPLTLVTLDRRAGAAGGPVLGWTTDERRGTGSAASRSMGWRACGCAVNASRSITGISAAGVCVCARLLLVPAASCVERRRSR